MNPRITFVQTSENYKLILKFTDTSIREFDMEPYLKFPAFEDLKEEYIFKILNPCKCKGLIFYHPLFYNAPTSAISGISAAL